MRWCFVLLFALLGFTAFPQAPGPEKVEISLLTCGTGEELYASFGHTGVRVRNLATGRDEVYNYGMFNFSEPNFYTKFMRGKLLYYIGKESFGDFMSIYEYEGRSVLEQRLILDSVQEQQIIQFLETNLLPQNKSYKYDFLYDNCATRVRDIFPKSLGASFKFGPTLEGKKVTFREILNMYLANNHWSRLGINILLASPIDKVMTDEESMFLPDMLMEGVKGATLNQQRFADEIRMLRPGPSKQFSTLNQPLWMMMGLLMLTLAIFFLRPLQKLKAYWSFILLFVTGLLGSLILFMWLGTDHLACRNNFNFLWTLPTNLFVAFSIFKARRWHKTYAMIGFGGLIGALLLHLIGIQKIPLLELLPFFFCMLFVFMYLYKRGQAARVA